MQHETLKLRELRRGVEVVVVVAVVVVVVVAVVVVAVVAALLFIMTARLDDLFYQIYYKLIELII